jgi:cytochrome c biogenesis protein CcmG/thiol:disulfide interchange protein DsbE
VRFDLPSRHGRLRPVEMLTSIGPNIAATFRRGALALPRNRLRIGICVVIVGTAIAIHQSTRPVRTASKTPGLVTAAALPACPASTTVRSVAGGLPNLTLPCLGDGPAVRLAGLRGTPLVVNIWAGPCPPCKREAPLLQRYFSEVGGRVRLLGVVDGAYPDTVNDALSAAHGLGMHYPSVFDASGQLPAVLRVRGIPVTLFVDAAGRTRHVTIGEVRVGELEQLTTAYLGVPFP